MPTPADNANDAQLLLRFREGGDRGALSLLMERHRGLAYRVALSVLRNPADAEDAAQDAFVNLLAYEPRVRLEESLSGLVSCMALRAAQRLGRASARRRVREDACRDDAPAAGGDPLETLAEDEARRAVRQEVASLAEVYRVPIVLYYFEGLSTEETARALGISPGATRTRLSRAVGKLRSRMGSRAAAVGVPALLALLQGGRADAVPSSLAARLEQFAATAPQGCSAAATGGASLWLPAGALKAKALAALAVVGVVAGVVAVRHPARRAPGDAPAPDRGQVAAPARPAGAPYRPLPPAESAEPAPGARHEAAAHATPGPSSPPRRAGAPRPEAAAQGTPEVQPALPKVSPAGGGALPAGADVHPSAAGDGLQRTTGEVAAVVERTLKLQAAGETLTFVAREGQGQEVAQLNPGETVTVTWVAEGGDRVVRDIGGRGVVEGTVTALGEGFIEVTPAGGKPQRFVTSKVGGGPNREIAALIARQRVENRVALTWEMPTAKRVVGIRMLAAAEKVELKAGDKAPALKLKATDDKEYTLAQFQGKSAVALVWFLRAGSGGSKIQLAGIQEKLEEIGKYNVQVLGITTSTLEQNKEFARELKLTFPLLSDPDKAAATAYGALRNGTGPTCERWVFLIDDQGAIRNIEKGQAVAEKAKLVLQALEDQKIPKK